MISERALRLIFVFMCLYTWTQAQQNLNFLMPYIRHFTPENYNAQNQNWGIAQGKEGQMYFANNAGLLEFDGSVWSLNPLSDRQTLRSVCVNEAGLIFGGGFETFGYWDVRFRHDNHFRILNEEMKISLGKEEIWNIINNPEGLYFQSFSTIYKFDTEKITPILPPGNIMFLQAVHDRIYFQLIGGGIYELHRDNSLELLTGSQVFQNTKVSFILPGWQNSGLLIGTQDHGIFQYKEGLVSSWNHPLNQELKKFQLNKGIVLGDGSYVLGTILEGLYILNKDGTLLHHIHKETGLQNNTILSLFEDKAGNLWVGMDKGIDLIVLKDPTRYFNDNSGTIGTVYTASFHNGYLYLGTNQGVYAKSVLDAKGKFNLIQGTQGQVWTFYKDQFLLCGHNNGIYEINQTSARLISDINGGWSFAKIPDQPENLMVGVYSGLIKLRKNSSTNSWEFDKRISGFNEPVKKLLFDASDYLWVVHPQKGVHRILLDSGYNYVASLKAYDASQGLRETSRLHLFNWEKQVALKNTCVNIWNSESDQFQCKNQQRFGWNERGTRIFGSDSLWFISVKSQLWMGRRDSVSQKMNIKLVPDYEEMTEFISESGIPYFLFCQENGFAVLPQNSTQLKIEKSSKLSIWKVELLTDAHISGSFLEEGVKLQYAQNSLKFYFAETRFDQEPVYQYRLIGVSDQWSEPGTQSNVSFQNLPKGQYTFELKTEMAPEIVSFSFIIMAPWYLTYWAYLIYLTFFIFLLITIRHYWKGRLIAERSVFEQKMTEQAQLREAITSRERLEQEVHLKSRELAHAAMSLVRKNEVLTDLKTKLSEILKGDHRAKEIFVQINEHIESDQDWDGFVEVFNHVHDDFFKKIQMQYPDLTPGDLKLAAYLRLNLSTKEIAPLLNISVRGVENKRYRLRKKMDLPEDTNLTEYIMSL